MTTPATSRTFPVGARHTTCHRDGSLTYWSVYRQQWIARARRISADDYLAYGRIERDRLLRHFAAHKWTYREPPHHEFSASPIDE